MTTRTITPHSFYLAAEALNVRLAKQHVTATSSPALTIMSRVSRIPSGLEYIEYDLADYWHAKRCSIYPIEPRHLLTMVEWPRVIPWQF